MVLSVFLMVIFLLPVMLNYIIPLIRKKVNEMYGFFAQKTVILMDFFLKRLAKIGDIW